MTPEQLHILSLLSLHDGWTSGRDLRSIGGFNTGKVYPLLQKMEQAGLIESKMQDLRKPGMIRQRVYKATDVGKVIG